MNNDIMARFEAKQIEMVSLGMTLGLSHPDVVKASQELDEIHNEILRAEAKA